MKAQITHSELLEYAWDYINYCENYTIEKMSASGRVVQIKERKIPVISYFLKIWLPMNKQATISRSTFYNWISDDTNLDSKEVEGLFNSLTTDIIANALNTRGQFYAKNKLNWSDSPAQKVEQPLFVLN